MKSLLDTCTFAGLRKPDGTPAVNSAVQAIPDPALFLSATTAAPVTPAAINGWCVANHVNPIAPTSSPTLSAAFETGSGDGVTTDLAASLPLCAISATTPPSTAANICACGLSLRVAP